MILSRLWNQWSAFWYWKSLPHGHIWWLSLVMFWIFSADWMKESTIESRL
jgi:hypothetical protein